MNVTSALMDIAANPVTRDGKQTTPVTYDSNCLEEVCGSCAMIINGKARMACSALIDHLDQPIKLEPFSKFPVVRDLAVDRSVHLREPEEGQSLGARRWHLRPRLRPALTAGGAGSLPIRSRAASPAAAAWKPARNSPKTPASSARPPSRRCACSTRIPPAQALKRERLAALMGDGGIQECGYAQNCVEICPKDIPLTTSIAEVGGQVMKQALLDLFRR